MSVWGCNRGRQNCDESRAHDADRLLIRPANGRQADTGLPARTHHWKDTAAVGHSKIESQTESTATPWQQPQTGPPHTHSSGTTPDATLVECAGRRLTGCAYGDNSSDVRRQRSRRPLYLGERSSFTWESDPRAVQMAAFTRANPSDHSAFDALIDGGQKRSLSSRPGYALNTGLFR